METTEIRLDWPYSPMIPPLLSYLAPTQVKYQPRRERIIVPLDRHFVVYTGGAGLDEGAGLHEGYLFYTGLSRPWAEVGVAGVDDETRPV